MCRLSIYYPTSFTLTVQKTLPQIPSITSFNTK